MTTTTITTMVVFRENVGTVWVDGPPALSVVDTRCPRIEMSALANIGQMMILE